MIDEQKVIEARMIGTLDRMSNVLDQAVSALAVIEGRAVPPPTLGDGMIAKQAAEYYMRSGQISRISKPKSGLGLRALLERAVAHMEHREVLRETRSKLRETLSQVEDLNRVIVKKDNDCARLRESLGTLSGQNNELIKKLNDSELQLATLITRVKSSNPESPSPIM